ncbi:hypothetical protein LIER_09117 [Lithospermum erythrorhizon]|uniref:Reverse transcriptase Ty1/copia-type domain-containing protein n=1 Tax=Lithospermum erythrorhizon TaxID=34254 RepID=A0AAV3PFQ7_LITER
MVTAWLLHSVEREIAESVIYCDTAENVWNQLCYRLHGAQKRMATNIGDKSLSDDQFDKLVALLNQSSISGATEGTSYAMMVAMPQEGPSLKASLVLGKRSKGLYILDAQSIHPAQASCVHSLMWYCRLAVSHDNVFNYVPASSMSSTQPVQNGNSASSSSLLVSSLSPYAEVFVPNRSTRISCPPVYFQDYVCYGMSSPFASNHFSSPFCISSSFVASVLIYSEPTTYKQAITDPRWVVAMTKELDALSTNFTYEYTSLPPGKKLISSKWVYKIKLKSDGTIERLVSLKWKLDVNNAFLYGDLMEEIYMKPPKGVQAPQGHLIPNDTPGLKDPEHYRSLVSKLNFLTNTRFDLSYVVQTLSQFMQSPCESYMAALNHLLLYVHHTTSQGLLLKGSDQLILKAYLDLDWAACPTTKRNSAKAEYSAMANAAAEVTWLV